METVTLLIGPTKLQTTISKELLCGVSQYFQKAFNSRFRESVTSTIELPDDEVMTIESFIEWVYTRKPIDVLRSDYLNLYMIADKYDVPQLRKDVLNASFHFLGSKNTTSGALEMMKVVDNVFGHTPPASGLRRMIVEYCVWRKDKDWFEAEKTQQWVLSEPEIASDLLLAMCRRAWGGKDPFVHGSAEDYYDPGIKMDDPPAKCTRRRKLRTKAD